MGPVERVVVALSLQDFVLLTSQRTCSIKILALDLGKFNTRCCFFDSKTRKHVFLTASTDRNYLSNVFKKHQSDLVGWGTGTGPVIDPPNSIPRGVVRFQARPTEVPNGSHKRQENLAWDPLYGNRADRNPNKLDLSPFFPGSLFNRRSRWRSRLPHANWLRFIALFAAIQELSQSFAGPVGNRARQRFPRDHREVDSKSRKETVWRWPGKNHDSDHEYPQTTEEIRYRSTNNR